MLFTKKIDKNLRIRQQLNHYAHLDTLLNYDEAFSKLLVRKKAHADQID